MIIELTDKEGNALIELLDLAVRAKGLEVALTAHYLFEKIKKAHGVEKNQPIENVIPIPEK